MEVPVREQSLLLVACFIGEYLVASGERAGINIVVTGILSKRLSAS